MNKETVTYNQFWRLGFTTFLALLLTLAPCSVRNSIEQSLGLEKTTVANKSKSAEVKSGSCVSVDLGNDKNFSKARFLGFDADFAEEKAVSFTTKLTSPNHFSLSSYMGEAVKIPFYILYNCFKYHL